MNRTARPVPLTKTHVLGLTLAILLAALSTSVSAKLPSPPLSDEAKAKAAEAAAKTAHGGKVDNFKLCLAMDRAAATYFAHAKQAAKEVKPAAATPACEDPGVYVAAAPTPAGADGPPKAASTAAVAPAKK